MPNNASQRTWGKDVNSVLLNKESGDKRYVIWKIDRTLYLGKTDLDGTNWVPKIVITLPYSIEPYPATCHIYDSEILVYLSVIDDESNYKVVIVRCDLNGENASYSIIINYSTSRIYIDYDNNEIRYVRFIVGGYMKVGFSDFYGNGYTENQVTARTFGSYFEVARAGSKLLYFFKVNTTLYVAQSDLDCTNFVQRSTSKGIQSLSFAAVDGSYAYTTFFTQYTFGICKVSSVTSTTTDFSFIETTSIGFVYFDMFKENGELYVIEVSQDDYGVIFIVVGTCDLGLSSFSEESYEVGNFVDDVRVDVSGEYYKYAWSQEQLYAGGNLGSLHLWTYPGNGPITPITVQCQITDILIDASTGKTIIPLIGGV